MACTLGAFPTEHGVSAHGLGLTAMNGGGMLAHVANRKTRHRG